MPSGIDSRRKHANAAFHALEHETALQASRVTFGGKNVREVITAVANKKGVSGQEKVHLEELVEVAKIHGIPPLLEVVNSGYYAVYDGRNRSVEHNWAHVKHINPNQTTKAQDEAWRRLKAGERLGCKVRNILSSHVDTWLALIPSQVMEAKLKPKGCLDMSQGP